MVVGSRVVGLLVVVVVLLVFEDVDQWKEKSGII